MRAPLKRRNSFIDLFARVVRDFSFLATSLASGAMHPTIGPAGLFDGIVAENQTFKNPARSGVFDCQDISAVLAGAVLRPCCPRATLQLLLEPTRLSLRLIQLMNRETLESQLRGNS